MIQHWFRSTLKLDFTNKLVIEYDVDHYVLLYGSEIVLYFDNFKLIDMSQEVITLL